MGLANAIMSFFTPVSGPETSEFGMRVNPVTHKNVLHAGVDFGVPVGTPVGAAQSGRVTFAAPNGTYGNRVDIDHGSGFVSRYAHLSKINVAVGQTVAAQQAIALSGNTGQSTGPHLHFEILKNGTAVDPTQYLGGTRGQINYNAIAQNNGTVASNVQAQQIFWGEDKLKGFMKDYVPGYKEATQVGSVLEYVVANSGQIAIRTIETIAGFQLMYAGGLTILVILAYRGAKSSPPELKKAAGIATLAFPQLSIAKTARAAGAARTAKAANAAKAAKGAAV